jgi:endonuclease III
VLDRILHPRESKSYSVAYREAQGAIQSEIPEKFDARQRAYLLLKTHGQETCKRTKPKCEVCPVRSQCAFFASA